MPMFPKRIRISAFSPANPANHIARKSSGFLNLLGYWAINYNQLFAWFIGDS
jgi:hypothetical protein